MSKRKKIIILILFYFTSNIIIGLMLGPKTCSDGSSSGSIGKRGACSSHGGVSNSNNVIQSICSLTLTIFLMTLLFKSSEESEKKKPVLKIKETNIAAPLQEQTEGSLKTKDIATITEIYPETKYTDQLLCPKCGSVMQRRITKKGKYKGIEYYGCTNHPTCKGIRSI